MAVFHAAGDESDGPFQTGPFLYGGFVAPVLDWIEWFAPAWEERVLNGPSPIPYLHMVEIRSKTWRAKYGLTEREAESRVDEAVRVIRSTGSIRPVKCQMDGGHFRDAFRETKVVQSGPQPGVYALEPDYIGFLGFAYAALDSVAMSYPDAEKVDFVVERKSKVTHHINDFHASLAEALSRKGRGELVRLIGDLIPGGKDRVPLQAADVAMWHLRKYECGECDSQDLRRLAKMFNGVPMVVNGFTQDEAEGVAKRAKANSVASPFKPKVRRSIGGG